MAKKNRESIIMEAGLDFYYAPDGKPQRGKSVVEKISLGDFHEEMLDNIYPKRFTSFEPIPLQDVLKAVQENINKPKTDLYEKLCKDIQKRIDKLKTLISEMGIRIPKTCNERFDFFRSNYAGKASSLVQLWFSCEYVLNLLYLCKVNNGNDDNIFQLAQEMLSLGDSYTFITKMLPHADAAKRGWNQGNKPMVDNNFFIEEFEKKYREERNIGAKPKTSTASAARHCIKLWKAHPDKQNITPPTSETFRNAWKKAGYKAD